MSVTGAGCDVGKGMVCVDVIFSSAGATSEAQDGIGAWLPSSDPS